MSGWITGNECESYFRECESYLDSFHKTLPFWAMLDDSSLFHILAAFDALSTAIQVNLGPAIAEGLGVQPLKSIEDGLVTVVKWITEEIGTSALNPSEDMDSLERATEFLLHAMHYSDLQDFHISYNRDLMGLSANPQAKKIRFQELENQDELQALDWVILERNRRRRQVAGVSHKKLSEYQRVLPFLTELETKIDRGRFVFSMPRSLGDCEYQCWCDERLLESTTREFDPSDDLWGFSGAEATSFWRAIWSWSFAASYRFRSLSKHGREQVKCSATQVVSFPEFCSTIQDLSELSEEIVKAIVERLTYDPHIKRHDILLQPFLVSGGQVCWSPTVVTRSQYQRNMLKVMARMGGKTKSTADNVIGNRARPFLGQLGTMLAKQGYQYKIMSKFKKRNIEGDADLLAWKSKYPRELLVVEGKTLLPPDEINEVDSATTELIHAQGQLEKVIKFIMDGNGASLWTCPNWQEIEFLAGAVLTPRTTPNPRYDSSQFPYGTLEILETLARRKDLRSPRSIVEFLRERPWLHSLRQAEHQFKEIKVGALTYEIPEWRLPD